jgi:hypothetical protein
VVVSHSPALARVGVVQLDGKVSDEEEVASEGVLLGGAEVSVVFSNPLLEFVGLSVSDFGSGDTSNGGGND